MSRILFYSSQTNVSFSRIRTDREPTELTEYERVAWQFCHDWLSGKERFILHTSGSTGTPKPITLSRQQMAASAAMTGQALGLQAGDRALVNLNVQYIAGIMMLVRGLEMGLVLTILEPSSNPLSHFSAETPFEFQSYVPLQLQTILENTPAQIPILNSAKAILVGGAPVSQPLEEALQQITAPVFQTYAMTETVSHVALRQLNGADKQDFYQSLEGIWFETDSRGCLVVHATQLNDHPVVTNDVAELLSPTTFRWLGRIDNVINSGGVKVQAEKVEQVTAQVLKELNLSFRFFVAATPDTQLGEAVTLIIEGKPLAQELSTSIFQKLKTGLSRYEVPRKVHYLPQFLETPTAKIDRKQTLRLLQ